MTLVSNTLIGEFCSLHIAVNIMYKLYFFTLTFGRPFVKRLALCYRTVVCLSRPVCPLCDVGVGLYGQAVRWIKMPLGMDVGLGSGHIVLNGDPTPTERGHSCPHPLFGPHCSGTVAHLSNCWALVFNNSIDGCVI